jgi:Malate/lactate dehydrogenases
MLDSRGFLLWQAPVDLTKLQKISGYLPKDDGLKHALTGADIVVIPAGIPRQYFVHGRYHLLTFR